MIVIKGVQMPKNCFECVCMRHDVCDMCSVCKWKENVPKIMGEPTVWDYCPSCGARMKQNNARIGICQKT